VLAGSGARKPKRQQVAKACLACKRKKAKCSDGRPCMRRVRLRMASGRVDCYARSSAGTVAVIERPVEYKPDRALFGARVQKPIEDVDALIAKRGLQWLTGPIHRSVEAGWDAHVMVDLFASLPNDWIALLKGTCISLKVLECHRAEKRKLVEPDHQVPLAELLCMACAGSGRYRRCGRRRRVGAARGGACQRVAATIHEPATCVHIVMHVMVVCLMGESSRDGESAYARMGVRRN
jgi:hypothetical protein